MKSSKISPKVLSIENTGEPEIFDWQDAIVTFEGTKYLVKGHSEPQSVISSAFRRDGEILCTRKRDFGGCGKDAIKPQIVPLGVYLAEHGEEIQ